MSIINANGVNINQVSDHVKKWFKYMPNDITKEDVMNFKKQHDEAISDYPPFMKDMMSKDVTFPGCYMADRLRKQGSATEDEIQALLFNMGRQAMFDQKSHWKNCMVAYNKL